VHWNDILIATLALEKGFSVYAQDNHFPILQNVLGTILYQAGYNGMFNPAFESYEKPHLRI